MPAPKMRRLQSEYQAMVALREQSSLINFVCQSELPTLYEVEFSCRGLYLTDTVIQIRQNHRCDILLESGFPLLAPKVSWKTPIFHPNFKTPNVCLGDHWYPLWSIAEMCVTLCEMVQYKIFNIYDPLDHSAALWLHQRLEERPEDFPIDQHPVRDLDFEISRR